MTAWTTPKTWVADDGLTAAELNEQVRDNTLHLYERVVGYNPTTSSDDTVNSGTFKNINGGTLSFPVAAGKNYTFIFIGTWEHSSTGGGPIFGFDHPDSGTACVALFEYTGETSSISDTRDWVNAKASGTGVATADSAAAKRICIGHGRYICSTSGTFYMQFARNTGGTSTIHAGASLFVTSD
jgi:hypothetical protein